MPRRRIVPPRPILPDPNYNNVTLSKFITRMMLDGKRSTAAKVVYGAMERMRSRANTDPVEVFLKALDNVKPSVEVKSRRVGGSTYQVPVEVREGRREALAMRWLIKAARDRSGKAMSERLADELLDAYNSSGTAFKKKEDTHRMAEANKAFAHYRW
jgi:small subunit ribosomal protein S7